MHELDKLWDYNDPAATEKKFRAIVVDYAPNTHLSTWCQLHTQIARTYSLRSMFDEAHALLDIVNTELPAELEVAHVRYHLERGRTFNSAGKKSEAMVEFLQAKAHAETLQEDEYVIDALHMLAIAAPPHEAIALHEAAVLAAESSTKPGAKNWLGALYNNLGWAYFDNAAYEKALSLFLRALQWREEKKARHEIFIAKWCVARTLRALHHIDDAIKIQLGLLEEMARADVQDGYVFEELGELYLLKNEPISKMYFQFAYNILREDRWLSANEKPRLERLHKLSK